MNKSKILNELYAENQAAMLERQEAFELDLFINHYIGIFSFWKKLPDAAYDLNYRDLAFNDELLDEIHEQIGNSQHHDFVESVRYLRKDYIEI